MRRQPDNPRVSKASTEAKQARNAAEANALHAPAVRNEREMRGRSRRRVGNARTGPQADEKCAHGAVSGRETRYVCVCLATSRVTGCLT